jgi:hypothetical protein
MDDMDMLYNKLMNVYEWGGMEEGTMFLDDKSQLVPQNLRSLFIQIASHMVNNNKLDSATALLDKCYSSMPESILPMNLRLKAASANIYYRAGKLELGDKFAIEVAEDAAELVKYYSRFKTKGIYSVTGDKSENLDLLRNASGMMKQYKREELASKYQTLFEQLNNQLY